MCFISVTGVFVQQWPELYSHILRVKMRYMRFGQHKGPSLDPRSVPKGGSDAKFQFLGLGLMACCSLQFVDVVHLPASRITFTAYLRSTSRSSCFFGKRFWGFTYFHLHPYLGPISGNTTACAPENGWKSINKNLSTRDDRKSHWSTRVNSRCCCFS